MDAMATHHYKGWHFLCGGEQLPSGMFQSTVRYTPSDNRMRTLTLDELTHETARQALDRAKQLAEQWVEQQGATGKAMR